MGQSQKQTGKKFSAPRKPALGKGLVTKTLEQRYEFILVLQDLLQLRQCTSSRVHPTYCLAITVLPVRCLEIRLNQKTYLNIAPRSTARSERQMNTNKYEREYPYSNGK